MPGVSPTPGHESIALVSGVTTAEAPSVHRSTRPNLYSQFRGPFIFNETEEERLKREEEERKKKEDEDKKSNFKKVQEAREAAEARATEAERKLKEREEADKKAAEEELKRKEEFKTLADQKAAEAQKSAEEAAAEKAKRESVEGELAEFKKAQQEELDALLKEIPEEKRPPLDDSMTVPQKLKSVKHTMELLGTAKPPIGAPMNKKGEKADRLQELKKKGLNNLTTDEAAEWAELSGE